MFFLPNVLPVMPIFSIFLPTVTDLQKFAVSVVASILQSLDAGLLKVKLSMTSI